MKQPLTTYVILSTTIALLLTPLFPLKAPYLLAIAIIAGTVAHVLEVSVNIAIRKLTGSFVWTYHGPLTYYQNATSLINIVPFALASLYFLGLGEILGVFI